MVEWNIPINKYCKYINSSQLIDKLNIIPIKNMCMKIIAGWGAREEWWAGVREGFCEEGTFLQNSGLSEEQTWPLLKQVLWVPSPTSIPMLFLTSAVAVWGKPPGTWWYYLTHRNISAFLPQVFSPKVVGIQPSRVCCKVVHTLEPEWEWVGR